jgi:hypothetical protein
VRAGVDRRTPFAKGSGRQGKRISRGLDVDVTDDAVGSRYGAACVRGPAYRANRPTALTAGPLALAQGT